MWRRDAVLLSIVLTATAACAGPASTLDVRGAGAAHIVALTWVLVGVMAVVYALVLGLLLAVVRRRTPAAPQTRGDGWARVGIIVGGVVLPAVVVPVLTVASVRTLAVLTRPETPALVVEVYAHQYWWELRYRTAAAEPMITANELHLPVGRRVEVRLHSTDVIHSFWVPSLQGKLDLVPGKVNVTWLEASRAGRYHGQCAEYCGIQHAMMRLVVVAEAPAQFEAWLDAQRRPAVTPANEEGGRGQKLFLVHCASCHRVRGTAASFGTLGPDLTHVGSRTSLAAGSLPNVRGYLAGWIADPQTLKPGNRMPRVPLAADEFHAVLAYVDGLR